MPNDELRSAVLDVLARARGVAFGPHVEVADALLPVVTAWARERAAAIVHDVARSLPPTQDREANRLHDAADALAADDRT